jgi:hypothetical protein
VAYVQTARKIPVMVRPLWLEELVMP